MSVKCESVKGDIVRCDIVKGDSVRCESVKGESVKSESVTGVVWQHYPGSPGPPVGLPGLWPGQ